MEDFNEELNQELEVLPQEEQIEEWKTIPEEGLEYYQISNTGKARLLPRVVDTHIVNRGRDLIVPAKRRGKDLSISYDGGTPTIRLRKTDGARCRRSLPLLVLSLFGTPCPGDIVQYTAHHVDNDVTNNHIDNLVWMSKAMRASNIGKLTLGEEKEHFQKYKNIVIFFYDYVIAYFKNTTDAIRELNDMGFSTSEAVLTRALNREDKSYFHIFNITTVDDETYHRIELNNEILNVKKIYDIILMDRQRKGRIQHVTDTKVLEKVVYVDRKTNQKVRKPSVNKSIQPKVTKPTPLPSKVLPKKPVHTHIDDLTDDDFLRDMEKQKRDKFKEELMRRMKNG